MRVAMGSIMQETNTFCAEPATMSDFAPHILRGDQILDVYAGTRTGLGGFLDAARVEGFDVVPLYSAQATSSGLTNGATFETLTGELLAALQAALPVDGVLLALHGAMAADGALDADGEIVRRVRRVVGPDVPIAVELDFHANVSRALVEQVDILVGYDTYPHLDIYDRGVEAGTLLARRLRGQITPVCAWAGLPLLMVPQAQFTARPPMSELLAAAHRLEREPGMLAVTVSGGFCYADVPHAGLSVTAVADGDRARAAAAARRIAQAAWIQRERFRVSNHAVAAAVARAVAAPRGPVILVDVGDNVGGGGSGDGTVLLRALLEAGAKGAVVTIADPAAVAAAIAAGVGAEVTLPVGGKVDDRHGSPLTVTGRVRVITDGRYVHKGPFMTGAPVYMGRSVVLEVGGNDILLTERKTAPFDLQQLRSVGIEPTDRRIIVVKAAVAWRAAYEPIAAEIIEVDTPGVTSTDLRAFSFRHVRRPIYPLDPDARYEGAPS
jgi:microcystin degradation protein MlrC